MKEYPILFNSEMVRATLEGKKTQTRRAIKPQPYIREEFSASGHSMGNMVDWKGTECHIRAFEKCDCPYGQPGDRLWVRETWKQGYAGKTIYKTNTTWPNLWGIKWKPSIHMRRKDSRITLEITNVRVERVQTIYACCRQEDLWKEGFSFALCRDDQSARDWFKELWDSINNKRGYGWDKNPWVWVIEFKKLNI